MRDILATICASRQTICPLRLRTIRTECRLDLQRMFGEWRVVSGICGLSTMVSPKGPFFSKKSVLRSFFGGRGRPVVDFLRSGDVVSCIRAAPFPGSPDKDAAEPRSSLENLRNSRSSSRSYINSMKRTFVGTAVLALVLATASLAQTTPAAGTPAPAAPATTTLPPVAESRLASSTFSRRSSAPTKALATLRRCRRSSSPSAPSWPT